MNLHEMMDSYAEEGLTRALAASRVCQDIVLKALSEGLLSRNVTIKGDNRIIGLSQMTFGKRKAA